MPGEVEYALGVLDADGVAVGVVDELGLLLGQVGEGRVVGGSVRRVRPVVERVDALARVAAVLAETRNRTRALLHLESKRGIEDWPGFLISKF